MTAVGSGHRPDGRAPGECRDDDLDNAATGTGVVPVFQPIVSLPDRATVGFEALARWPDLPGCTPERVFDHAGATGVADELDRACITAAIDAALRSPLTKDALLSVNAEPSTSYRRIADDDLLALGHAQLTVMFEITERSPLAHPQQLLRKVSALRSDGFAVALDDVGVHPDSLALLDVVMPDVIKLDLALIQSTPTREQARTLAAVLAHHERTGAVILAEGVETEAHLEQALAVGATLGQGFFFGRPGPLGPEPTGTWSQSAPRHVPGPGIGSPFDLVAGTSPVRTARKEILTSFSRHIESQAVHAADPPMVFTALQRGEYFSGGTRDQYRMLGAICPLVAVFGEDMPTDLGAGVRGVSLDAADPVCTEWTVVALGPLNAAALIARERLDDGDRRRRDGDRRFDFVITYDRTVVAAAARSLLERMP